MEGGNKMLSGFGFGFALKKSKGTLLATVACLGQKESNGYSNLKGCIIFSISFLKTDQEMDKGENKIQPLGICNEFLCYIMSFGCPVCYSLSICRWLFYLFKDAVAEIAGHVYMITSLGSYWRYGFLIFNRLYEFVVQSLAAEAIKSVTLGDSMDYSLVKTSQSRANPGNRNSSSNEQILHSEDLSSHVLPKLEESVIEDDSVLKNGENDLSQLISEENDADEIVEEEASEPSMETQNKAPKKMVSINDNVEEIYFSKKKKMKKKKSTEKVPSIKEQEKEEPKPLKSILKVGSNANENWDQNK